MMFEIKCTFFVILQVATLFTMCQIHIETPFVFSHIMYKFMYQHFLMRCGLLGHFLYFIPLHFYSHLF